MPDWPSLYRGISNCRVIGVSGAAVARAALHGVPGDAFAAAQLGPSAVTKFDGGLREKYFWSLVVGIVITAAVVSNWTYGPNPTGPSILTPLVVFTATTKRFTVF